MAPGFSRTGWWSGVIRMFNLFSKRDMSGMPAMPEIEIDPEQIAAIGARCEIADVELVDQTAVGTLTVTDLSTDSGVEPAVHQGSATSCQSRSRSGRRPIVSLSMATTLTVECKPVLPANNSIMS